MAKPEWGSKHTCPSCGAKFYNMKRSPIVCPSCEQEVVVQPLLKPRRQAPAEPKKAPAPAKVVAKAPEEDNDETEDEVIEDDDDLVLDDDDDSDDDLIEDDSDIDDDVDVAAAAKTDDTDPKD